MRHNWIRRGLTTLLAGLIVVYVGYQFYQSSNSGIRTEIALAYTAYDDIRTNGFFIRKEQVLHSDVAGYRSYSLADGSKVAKDGVVAEVYGSEAAALAKAQAAVLDKEIDSLEKLMEQGAVETDLDMLGKQLSNCMKTLLSQVEMGDFKGFDSSKNEVLSLLNKQQIVTGQVEDFGSVIRGLRSEKESLRRQYSKNPEQITTPKAGYFVKEVDGYENRLDLSDLSALTASEVLNMTPDAGSDSDYTVGKIVEDYEWYIACVLDFEQASNFFKGQKVGLKIGASTLDELPATVQAINRTGPQSDVLLLFRCTNMNSELAKMRQRQISIILQRYDGIRINSGAIRFAGEQKGVYLIRGAQAKFCPVETLYTGDGYAICKETEVGETGLKRFDEIIVEGKDLYEGKVVK